MTLASQSNSTTDNTLTPNGTKVPEDTLCSNDFRFVRFDNEFTKYHRQHRDQIVIQLLRTDKTYSPLSHSVHKCYIQHNIPQIPNEAPTLQQFFIELTVYEDDLQRDDPNKPLKECEPNEAFFKNANDNFASSTNARRFKPTRMRHYGRYTKWMKPIYYYYVDPLTKQSMHLSPIEARRLYCKTYESTTLTKGTNSYKLFKYLHELCIKRDRTYPIVILGVYARDALDQPTDIAEAFYDTDHVYFEEYCLAEMLIHYPNLNKCVWHRKIIC